MRSTLISVYITTAESLFSCNVEAAFLVAFFLVWYPVLFYTVQQCSEQIRKCDDAVPFQRVTRQPGVKFSIPKGTPFFSMPFNIFAIPVSFACSYSSSSRN